VGRRAGGRARHGLCIGTLNGWTLGVIAGYARNVATNTMLGKRGIGVVITAGRGLVRGRGTAGHELPDRA
jgi:hypothetical protein